MLFPKQKKAIHNFFILIVIGIIALFILLTSYSIQKNNQSLKSKAAERTDNTRHALVSVWLVDGLTRVSKAAEPGSNTTIHLSAARNEYESYQIVLQPNEDLSNVNLTFSDLQSTNGGIISTSNITPYREYYMTVKNSSREFPNSVVHRLEPGSYPDGLIPFTNPATHTTLNGSIKAITNVSTGENQPYWVDIYVPENTPPGDYVGSYKMISDQGIYDGSITFTVWNFTLPHQPKLYTDFHVGSGGTKRVNINKVLLTNKVSPGTVLPNATDPYIQDFGLNNTGLQIFSNIGSGNCQAIPVAPSPPADASIEAQLQKLGSGKLLIYGQGFDELSKCSHLNSGVMDWALKLHKYDISQILTMVPSAALIAPGTDGRPPVDIWVNLPRDQMKNIAIMDEVKANPKIQSWSYTTLAVDAFSPKWFLDYAPINYRIMPGFLNQATNNTGILYWRVDKWNTDPWNDPDTFQNCVKGTELYPNCTETLHYNGEGVLVYPGDPVGLNGSAVPSLRLKWIRDGVEDYDYLEIYKSFSSTYKRDLDKVAKNWDNWQQDPVILASAREEMGGKISAHFPSPTLSPSSIPPPSLTPDSTANSACTLKEKGDADCNGAINIIDYFYLVRQLYGGDVASNVSSDFNHDNKVDLLDRKILIRNLHIIRPSL